MRCIRCSKWSIRKWILGEFKAEQTSSLKGQKKNDCCRDWRAGREPERSLLSAGSGTGWRIRYSQLLVPTCGVVVNIIVAGRGGWVRRPRNGPPPVPCWWWPSMIIRRMRRRFPVVGKLRGVIERREVVVAAPTSLSIARCTLGDRPWRHAAHPPTTSAQHHKPNNSTKFLQPKD